MGLVGEVISSTFLSCGILSKSSFFLFNNKINRIWKMFFERFSLSPCQLRASKIDIAECFNLDQLAKTLKKVKITYQNYLYLPNWLLFQIVIQIQQSLN